MHQHECCLRPQGADPSAVNAAQQLSDPNLRKAAIMLSMLGEDEATTVCRQVDPLTAHRLIRVLSALREMDPRERRALRRPHTESD